MFRIGVCLLISTGILAFPVFTEGQEAACFNSTHYTWYHLGQPQWFNKRAYFMDQFGLHEGWIAEAGHFLVPADKNWEGIQDTITHYTVYPFLLDVPTGTEQKICVTNQLGPQTWVLQQHPELFVLVPARKNWDPGVSPPEKNHYLCYRALSSDPDPNVPVTLDDQFTHSLTTVVRNGAFFCNPAEKYVDGMRYGIVDSTCHLACYDIDVSQADAGFFFRDQFFVSHQLAWADMVIRLCVPSTKQLTGATPVRKGTWGMIKTMYR